MDECSPWMAVSAQMTANAAAVQASHAAAAALASPAATRLLRACVSAAVYAGPGNSLPECLHIVHLYTIAAVLLIAAALQGLTTRSLFSSTQAALALKVLKLSPPYPHFIP